MPIMNSYLGPLEELVLLAVNSLKDGDYEGLPEARNHVPRDVCAVRVREKLEAALGHKLPRHSAYRTLRRLVKSGYLRPVVFTRQADGSRYRNYILTEKALRELRHLRWVRRVISRRGLAAG